MNAAIRDPRRRLPIVLGASLLGATIFGGGCGPGSPTVTNQPGASSPESSAAQRPTDEGPVDRATSARTFWEAVRALPIHEVTRLAPGPSTLDSLVDRSTAIVRGQVAKVVVVDRPWAPEPDLPNPASEVVIRLTVTDTSELVPSEVSVPTALDWEVVAWQGDPEQASEVVEEIRDEVGMGPVGGDVILYLSPRAANHELEGSPPRWFAISGMLAAGGETEVLTLTDAGPLANFDDLDALEDATRRLGEAVS
mgnify:CR=1 FL=1